MSTTTPGLAGVSAIKLALMAQKVREQSQELLSADPIAIVGIACRVPGGGDTPELYWQLLRDGVDTIGPVPADRWNGDAWFDADLSVTGKIVTRQGGFLPRIDGFDAGYFGILPREAERMDPQQRLFLEVASEALDDAGLTREQLRGSRTGVFVASYHNDYAQLQYNDVDAIDLRTLTGTLHSVLANRLSHFLDLRGPSLSVDTACSSSLVATHLACQSLRLGESDVAVAGGVSLIITPELFVAMSKVGFMAPDGRCKTFDAAADGFGRGEGCGVVILKRLADAVAEGDRVLAVVRGSAVNQDGHSTLLAAPSGPAQQALLQQALANAQLDAGRIGFIETHGTGTALGDPIEVEAIAATIGQAMPGAGPCLLGAAKANLGHLEAAAGVAGLIKTVLALRHEAVPAQVHFKTLSPHITLKNTRLAIPRTLTPWPRGPVPRCAGTSSFGVGGTNAHVIVEEAPPLPADAGEAVDVSRVLPLSAQSPQALQTLVQAWLSFLEQTPESEVDLCFTATQRRSHHTCRVGVVGHRKADWRARLHAVLQDGIPATAPPASAPPRVAFVFSGQGPQWFGMGRELLASEPVFREVLVACDAHLRDLSGWSLLDELAATEELSRLDQTEVAQPALFALQAGLVALWRSWGIAPAAVVGHSVGEVAALYAADALTLAEALRVVWQRGRAMQQATGGGQMASVGLSAAQAAELTQPFGPRLSVAAVNGPRSVVLSGEAAALQQALATLGERGVSHQMLPVNYAFHSTQMAASQQELVQALDGLRVSQPAIAVYSTVTGGLATDLPFDAAYFGRNVRETVQLAPAIEAMSGDGIDVFIEVGPHPVLGSAIAECLAASAPGATVLASLRRGKPERDTLLQACANAWAAGCAPDWDAVQQAPGAVVSLPAYPWQRERYWLRRASGTGIHPLLGRRLPLAGTQAVVFEGDSGAAQDWLTDHRIFGHLLLPATAVMELFAAAASVALGTPGVTLTDFAMDRALVLPEPEHGSARWQTVVTLLDGGRAQLELHEALGNARDEETTWRRIARALAQDNGVPAGWADSVAPTATVAAERVHARFRELGVTFGPNFRCFGPIERGDGLAQAWVELPAGIGQPLAQSLPHPVLLDAALQLCSVAAPASPQGEWPARVLLPVGAERVQLRATTDRRLLARVRVRAASGVALLADFRLESPAGEWVASIEGMRFVPADPASFATSRTPLAGSATLEPLYVTQWQQLPNQPPEPLARADGLWLVFADRSGAADTLIQALVAAGGTCVRADAAAGFHRLAPDHWTIDPAEPAQFRRLLAELPGDPGGLRGVVHLWSLDLSTLGDTASPASDQQDLLGLASALHLVQALTPGGPTPLCFVTRGAHVVSGDEPVHSLRPRAAGVWGLAGVVAAENADWHVQRIELDPSEPASCCTGLLAPLLAPQAAPRSLALRSAGVWIARLQRLAPAPEELAVRPLRLELQRPGTLDGAALGPMPAVALQPDEVRLRVLAAGLNFRDVLLTLGMYPGGGIPLGAECAGIATEVGADVHSFKPGDFLYGYAPGSLATDVVVRADFLAAVPQGLSAPEAAALPVAFLTAVYGLERLAKLRRGERVLIHAAAGGVGLAAVQVAQRIGAEVYATAGSDRKRALLRGLGVAQVFDSRSLAFADQILAATGGAGVQVVLNSLAGEFIAASLRALGQGGRFLELGKRDILTPQALTAQRPDVIYHPYDLGTEAQTQPGLLTPMFNELGTALTDGSLRALPVQVFSLEHASDAMRHMAQARHTGKIVLVPRGALAQQSSRIDSAGSYWITGGLGALGLATARWLVGRGARHLVLTGRRAPDDAALRRINELQALGAAVHVMQADAADAVQMQAVRDSIARRLPPLRGVVHAAGTLHDAVLGNQQWSEARRVVRGKAHGAWVLHALTRDMPLDFFIMYSAAGLLLGAAGQGLYPAANAELDALARARQLMGLPALSVAWGAWAGPGMAAGAAAQGRDVWAERGLATLTPAEGFAGLQGLLRDRVACAAVLPIDWSQFMSRLPLGVDREFFAAVASGANAPAPAARPAATLASLRSLPAGQRHQGLVDQLRAQALQVLGVPPTTPVNPRLPLKEIGLDSLMAVELRNALTRAFGQALPVTLLFDYPTLDALAAQFLRLLGLESGAARETASAAPADSEKARAGIEALSDADAEAQLLAELDGPPPGRSP